MQASAASTRLRAVPAVRVSNSRVLPKFGKESGLGKTSVNGALRYVAAGHTKHQRCHGAPVGEQPKQVLVCREQSTCRASWRRSRGRSAPSQPGRLRPGAELREILVVSGAIGKYALAGAHAADHGAGRVPPLKGKKPHATIVDIPTAHRLEELGRCRLAPESQAIRLVAFPSRGFQPQERVNGGTVGPHAQARARPEGGVQMQAVLAYRAAPVLPIPSASSTPHLRPGGEGSLVPRRRTR